jgi:hypothetical protein
MSVTKLSGIIVILSLPLAIGSIARAQDRQPDEHGSKSLKSVTLQTISPYLPTAAAFSSNNTAGGFGIGAQMKQFYDLEVKVHNLKLADVFIDIDGASGSGTIYADHVESIETIFGAGLTVDLLGGLFEISVSRLTGRVEACGSTTIPLTPGHGGGGGGGIDTGDAVFYTPVDGDSLLSVEPTPESARVSYCLKGDVEILELDIKARILRVDLRLADGQWLYFAAGTTLSVESYEIRFDDGQTVNGTSIGLGGFVEAGLTLSSSVRISISATHTFTGTGHKTVRDDGTFVTAGLSIGL